MEAASNVTRFMCFLLINLLLPKTWACPNTTCCECVSTPGCSWFTPPDDEEHQQPAFCAESPFLETWRAPEWARRPGGPNVIPSVRFSMTVMRDEPLNQARNINIRPQRVTIESAVGYRHEIPVQLTARRSRVRIQVRGPRAVSSGHIEFSLHRADSDSCAAGLTEIVRTRGATRGGRPARRQQRSTTRRRQSRRLNASSVGGNAYPRRRTYACRGGGPNVVHNFVVAVDVKRCLREHIELRVVSRQSGQRSLLRLRVNSLCDCPLCSGLHDPSASGFNTEGNVSSTERSNDMSSTTSDNCDVDQCGESIDALSLSPLAALCQRRGVNDVCLPHGTDESSGLNSSTNVGHSCSGRGICLCGECRCTSRHELFPQFMYSGTRCECDDFSCPRDNGAMCGGPTKGRCTCGECVCYADFTGGACEISVGIDHCVDPHTNGEVCSGFGECVNGECQCPWPYAGQFCQCNEIACPRSYGEICGGSDRGRCSCGECVCQSGFYGRACEIDGRPETCLNRNPSDGITSCPTHQGEECGGDRGTCVCGHCVCQPDFTGAACQDSYYDSSAGLVRMSPPASCVSSDPAASNDGDNDEGVLSSRNMARVCSGRGICIDGACVCSQPFGGSVCQDCPFC